MNLEPDVSFIQSYCKIDKEEANKRVQDTIKKVEETLHVYGCVRAGLFGKAFIHLHPKYQDVSARFTNPDFKLLELGCCFGTDIRKMISDGLRQESITVSDLTDGYWNVGANVLFKDNLNVKAVFTDFAVDPVVGLEPGFDVISAQAVLHVLSKPQVETFLKNCFNYLYKDGILFGTCGGSDVAKEWEEQTPTKGLEGRVATNRYLHSVESLTELLTVIGFQDVQVTIVPPDFLFKHVPGTPTNCLFAYSCRKGEFKPDVSFIKEYCKIDEKEATKRILDTIRVIEESHHVYKCIQMGMFGRTIIHLHPQYPEIKVNFVKPNFKLLELGCCFGTDARKMISDGLNPSSITVSDLTDVYWQTGKAVLFKDNLNVKAVFTDFATESPVGLEPGFSAISAQLILHVLSKDQCQHFLSNCFKYLVSGGMLFGTCVGSATEPHLWGKTPTKGLNGRQEHERFLHNKESLTQLLESFGFKVKVGTLESWVRSGSQPNTRQVQHLYFFAVKP
ncbi:hypothetical protein HK103_006230 [Boothiomyces macroporosus]|uniref:Uncharacterized protein n=1 Tax=Boothiomyces macroporosus TaxID=261099 RepID=A0AAD5UH64_9FUNG|nr:hypothetical protein HK103_006230 [Boothiomyces macroporosus]